jgi:hypothetical protein
MAEQMQSTVQAATEVANRVVTGLSQSPMLLGLMVINAIGIGAAIWFLARLSDAQGKRVELLMKACLPLLTKGNP